VGARREHPLGSEHSEIRPHLAPPEAVKERRLV